MRTLDWNQVYYVIPLGIGAVAIYMAWEQYRAPKWDPTNDQPVGLSTHCAPNRYVCRDRRVYEMTGDETVKGSGACVEKLVGACTEKCVADGVTFRGIDLDVARTQSCDPPDSVSPLIEEERSNLNLTVGEAGTCDADGFAPDDFGFHQCILASGRDPSLGGAITATAHCRNGVVQTTDRSAQLVSREQAAALWCRRDRMLTAARESIVGSASASASASTAPSSSTSVAPKTTLVIAPTPLTIPSTAPPKPIPAPAPVVSATSTAPLPALLPPMASASTR